VSTLRPARQRLEVDLRVSLPGRKRLAKLPDVESVEQSVEDEFETTYFDTADLALTRAGITVCRHSTGAEAGWQVALPAAKGGHDLHIPLGRAVRTVPKEGRAVVGAFAGEGDLSAVARTRTRRTTYQLLDAKGARLATLHDDTTRSLPLGDDERTADTHRWRAWHLSLDDGSGALARALTATLEDRGATPSASVPVLARAHELKHPEWSRPVPPTSRSADASETVLAHVFHEVVELRRYDPLVRADAPDAVHRMRVATRRLRSALATYRPFLDSEVVGDVRAELAWLATELGAARDAEVTRKRMTALLSRESADLVGSILQDRLSRDLTDRYEAARRGAVEALQSDRYRKLLDRLDDLVMSPPWTAAAHQPSRLVLPGRLHRDR